MDLSVRDVAKLMNVSEDEVYRWVRGGTLPFHRVHDQYRFNRVELQEWAVVHRQRVSPELFASGGLDLAAAIERGGVFYDLPGDTREEVLKAVSRLPGIPAHIDRTLLHKLLVSREALASTGVGEGIAFPHPRDPVVVPVDDPHVLVAFLAHPVSFDAIDGKPVYVLFTILSPSVRTHLQVLAKLAFGLHDAELKALIEKKAGADAILGRIRALEPA